MTQLWCECTAQNPRILSVLSPAAAFLGLASAGRTCSSILSNPASNLFSLLRAAAVSDARPGTAALAIVDRPLLSSYSLAIVVI